MTSISDDPRSLRRLEDARFLRGEGRYVDDGAAAGALHAVFVRSPHAHARLRGIDAAAALAVPGVRAVLTAADMAAAGAGPIPCVVQLASVAPLIVPPRLALAAGTVRHVGEAVAVVVAETATAARDGADEVRVEYDSLSSVTDLVQAGTAEAPQLWPEAPGNEAFRFQRGDQAAVAAAFAARRTPSRSTWSTTAWSPPRSSPAAPWPGTTPPPAASISCSADRTCTASAGTSRPPSACRTRRSRSPARTWAAASA